MSTNTTVSLGPSSGGDGTAEVDIYVKETGSDLNTPSVKSLNFMSNANSARYWNEYVNLASGDNTFTLPTSTNGVAPAFFVLQLPSTNTIVSVTVRTNNQTGGMTIAKKGVFVLPFDNASLPTSVIVNASSSLTGVKQAWL